MASPAANRRHAPTAQGPMAFLSLALLLLLGHSQVAATPSIQLSTSSVTVSAGQTASLSCMVEDQGTLVVTWWNLNHRLQISYGRVIVTDDPRYTILTPPDGEEWTLQIAHVRPSDAGVYQCGLSPGNYGRNQTLTVRGTSLPPRYPNVPGPPTSLRSMITSQTSIRITWDVPSVNPQLVQGYRIFYQEMNNGQFNLSTQQTNHTYYELQGLMYGKTYQIYMTAVGAQGSSAPSYTLVVLLTSSTTASQGAGVHASGLVMDCCQRQNVRADCLDVLCGLDAQIQTDSSILGCYSEVTKLFQCVALQGNHTSCCRNHAVPGQCLPLCEGQAPLLTSQVDCMAPSTWTLIEACVDQGAASIPGPPSSVELVDVTSSTASLQWEQPVFHPDKVDHYEIRYQREGQEQVNLIQTSSLMYQLTNLFASTHYTVSIISVGTRGTSLPSDPIIFLTYYTEGATPPLLPSGPPPTIQQCCTEIGVSEECHYLCSYETDLSTPSREQIACSGYLGHHLACAAGDKNHTQCCMQRGVQPECYDFCAFTRDQAENYQLQSDHLVCLSDSAIIFQCMEEGQLVIPSWPENFSIQRVTTGTITVQWTAPSHIPADAQITGFLVQHRLTADPGVLDWPWITFSAGLRNNYIIQHLAAGVEYEMQVLSVSTNGTSLPSIKLTQRTHRLNDTGQVGPDDGPITAPVDVSECCRTSGVSDQCISGCTPSGQVSFETCADQLPKILTCAADGRDYTQCCEQRNVPSLCVGFCSNFTGNITYAHVFCRNYMTEIVTCMVLGHRYVPSQPTNFTIVQIATNELIVKWSPPAQNGAGVTYNLYHKNANMQNYVYTTNVVSPFTLSNLQPAMYYDLYLTAVSTRGASQPTPTIRARTLHAGIPSVVVEQTPPGFVQIGDSVNLTCQGLGDGVTTYWLNPNGTRITEDNINFERITEEDGGKYSCIATNTAGRSRAGILFVKIQSALIVRAVSPVVQVQPNRGVTATLSCTIQGYPPMDNIKWLKNYAPMNVSSLNRYQAWNNDREVESIIEAVLVINDVTDRRPSDYATYTCEASSHYGTANADIILQPVDGAGVTTSPISPAQRVINVTSCCMSHGVTPSCLDACDFDVDPGVLGSLPDPVACIPHLGTLAVCAADGRSHIPCCVNASIPNLCLPFCAGVSPDLTTGHLQCVQYIETIIDCMEKGHEVIPSAPTNVQAHVDPDHYILVQWESPRLHADKVQKYIIVYSYSNRPTTSNIIVDRDVYQGRIPAVVQEVQYSIHVLAWNHYGMSGPSTLARLFTSRVYVTSPQNLQSSRLTSQSVFLSWDAPTQNRGALMSYQGFYYSGTPNKGLYFNATSTEYVLDGLQPSTRYSVYVRGVIDGNRRRTARSNFVYFTTLAGPGITARRTSGSSHKEGVVIGVIVAIIIVIALAIIVGVYWFFKKRNKPSSDEQPVVFENPGYGNLNKPDEGGAAGGVKILFNRLTRKGNFPESST